MLYRAVQRTIRACSPFIGGTVVEGSEHVPSSGPFLLIANHQSFIDPLLIQAFCDRPLDAMAKSTQFAVPGLGPLMARLRSFPVRRYQIDPQAVRVALRRLGRGRGVVIYIEGERSWDGRLKRARLGTLGLILKAGVPVVPCAIHGSYDALPRWTRRIRPRRRPIRIAFGPPLRFPQLDGRAEREAALPQTRERIMGTLARMLRAHERAERARS